MTAKDRIGARIADWTVVGHERLSRVVCLILLHQIDEQAYAGGDESLHFHAMFVGVGVTRIRSRKKKVRQHPVARRSRRHRI